MSRPATKRRASLQPAGPVISRQAALLRQGPDGISQGVREVPVEVPVALIYDGGTYAVMMATPDHLEDFALGFSLNEGLIKQPGEIERLEVVRGDAGIEIRMWLERASSRALGARRRMMAGPTGCGLCGADSLEAVRRELPVNRNAEIFNTKMIGQALAALGAEQALNAQTHAVHAAGLWTKGAGLCGLFEDVGRHNALDKLAGLVAREGQRVDQGIVVLTSRVSIEMVQKSAMIGAPVLAAISAPTSLAIEMADAAGITLIGVARRDGYEIFTHPQRIAGAL